jgi:hypothetical protein
MGFSQTAIVDDDVAATDTLFLVIEEGTVDLESYFRFNYVEISNGGYIVYNRTLPETTTDFLARLIREEEQWEQAISDTDAEIARLTAKKVEYEAIEAIIEAKRILLE